LDIRVPEEGLSGLVRSQGLHQHPRLQGEQINLTFPQYGNGCRISRGKVILSGFGTFKLFDHRRIIGQPKTVTIKLVAGFPRWRPSD
jgi:hypothetical protein